MHGKWAWLGSWQIYGIGVFKRMNRKMKTYRTGEQPNIQSQSQTTQNMHLYLHIYTHIYVKYIYIQINIYIYIYTHIHAQTLTHIYNKKVKSFNDIFSWHQ